MSAQLLKNLFDSPYAHTLLAFTGSPSEPGRPIGMAMYFFNYSTWTGKPGLYVRALALRDALHLSHGADAP